MATYGNRSIDLNDEIGVGGALDETVQQVEHFIDSSNDKGLPLALDSSASGAASVASGSGLRGDAEANGSEDD